MSLRSHTAFPNNFFRALYHLTLASSRLPARLGVVACLVGLLFPVGARAQDTSADFDQGLITDQGVISTANSPTGDSPTGDSPTGGARWRAASPAARSLGVSSTRDLSSAATSGALIGEFRARGTGGALDEYVEVANATSGSLDISGWTIHYLSAGNVVSATVPDGVNLPALGHYLFTGSGYTLAGEATSDQSLSSDMDDASGIQLCNAAGTLVDAVSFAGSSMAGEGTLLPSAPTDNGEYAFVRRQSSGSPSGVPLDYNTNVGDIIFVSTTAGSFSSVTGDGTSSTLPSVLGSPSPDSTTGFLLRGDLTLSLFDTAVSNSASPNRVRLNASVDNGAGTPDRYGTLRYRRTLTNTGTHTITALRFHIVATTTLNGGTYSDPTQADVRLLTSPDETGVASSSGARDVIGTSLQAPSASGYGGGYYANSVVLNQALLPGASANYSFELGVARKGNFLIGFDVEALPLAAPLAPTLTGTAGDAAALLSWNTPAGATGYKLFRSTTAGLYGEPVQNFGATDSSYTDSPLTGGTTYYYRLVATGAGGDSAPSNEVTVTPTAPFQPDVTLERLDSDGDSLQSVGENILDDAQQTLSLMVAPGHTRTYVAHIKNTSVGATTFRVSLGGLLSSAGAETPWNPTGWTVTATAGTSDVLAALQSAQGWETPSLNTGEETEIQLAFTAPTTTVTPVPDGSFRIVARKGTKSDAVNAPLASQFLTGLQWSVDGQTWTDVTPTTVITVERFTTVGIRALKAVPDAPWPGEEEGVIGPSWTWQGEQLEGGQVWLHATDFTDAAGATATAQFGATQSVHIVVTPAATPDDEALFVPDTD